MAQLLLNPPNYEFEELGLWKPSLLGVLIHTPSPPLNVFLNK